MLVTIQVDTSIQVSLVMLSVITMKSTSNKIKAPHTTLTVGYVTLESITDSNYNITYGTRSSGQNIEGGSGQNVFIGNSMVIQSLAQTM